MNVKKLSFSKKLRLQSSRDFSNTFKCSHKLITNGIIAYIHTNNLTHPRLGIIISKKNIKNAHKRNSIKRHIRESFRQYQHILPNIDVIITIQKNVIHFSKNTIKTILKKTWQNDNVSTNFKIINTTNTHIPNIY